MAKKPAKATKQTAPIPTPGRPRRGGDDNALSYLMMFGLIVLGIFTWQTAVLAALGMLPTFVLAATGRGANKNLKFQAIAYINLIGVVAICEKVFNNASVFERTLMDPVSLSVMWGCAGLGYLTVFAAPSVAAMILQALSQDRIKKLNVQRNQIVEAWGPEVTRFDDQENQTKK